MTDADHIQAARLRSNAAIQRQHVDAIASFWTDGIHVTSSTGRQVTGIEANRRLYVDLFAHRPDTAYVRTPSEVKVMPAWNVAMEEGDWVGTWTEPDGPVRITGRYMAQWRRFGTLWRIHGELYVPLECTGGAYCSRHPLAATE